MVIYKQKALGNLTDASVNILPGKTRTGKLGRPPTSTKLAEKEVGQQTIQFSSSPTSFTRTPTIFKQAFRSVLEAVKRTADINMEVALSTSSR